MPGRNHVPVDTGRVPNPNKLFKAAHSINAYETLKHVISTSSFKDNMLLLILFLSRLSKDEKF